MERPKLGRYIQNFIDCPEVVDPVKKDTSSILHIPLGDTTVIDPDPIVPHPDIVAPHPDPPEPYDPSHNYYDPRDNKTYSLKTYNGVVWMAEDLMHDSHGSKLVQSLRDGKTYQSRLYSELEIKALNLCPAGWKLPSRDDWTQVSVATADSFNMGHFGAYNTFIQPKGYSGKDTVAYYWVEKGTSPLSVSYNKWTNQRSFDEVDYSDQNNTFLACRCIKNTEYRTEIAR